MFSSMQRAKENFSGLQNSYQRFLRSEMGSAAARGVKESFGFVYESTKDKGFLGLRGSSKNLKGRMFSGVFNVGFTAYAAYQGYKEGGISGAIKGGGSVVAANAAINVGLRALGLASGPLLAIVAPIVAGTYGTYKYGEAAIKHGKKLGNIEMGGNYVDTFGTGNTLRQRSLAALQNTHVNGRLGIGNEGQLLHNIYMGR